jgi:Activator of osmoprotectant transporter ProP
MTTLTLGKPITSQKLDEIAAIQKQASIAKYSKIQQQEAEEARKKRYEVAIGILKSLEQLFPKCFSQTEPKPLKLHIEQDLFALESVAALGTKTAVRNALKLYTIHTHYLKATIEQDDRIDLEGNPVEKVEQKHKEYSKEQLEKRLKAKNNNKTTKPNKPGKPS